MKPKNHFNFIEPNIIMAVIISLMILAVGVFAFFSVTSGLEDTGMDTSKTQCWTIVAPSNPETLTGLPSDTIDIITVTEYYTDGTSAVIPATNYSWVSTNPTVINVNVTGG
jgi:hypothetical protein